MIHKHNLNRVSTLFVSLLLLILVSVPAMAVANTTNQAGSGNQSDTAQQGQSDTTGSDNSGGTNSQGTQAKGLNAEQLKKCEQSEARVQNMFSNMNRLGEGQLAFMDTVMERVQNFYEGSGLSAEGYQAAVAKLEQAQQAAQNQVRATVQTSNQYGCDKDDPKGAAQQYKTQVQSQISALKEYRTALKELIKIVKSADRGQQ